MKIAFIGLGIMGSRMAKNLLNKFGAISVYNRSQRASIELQELGAIIEENATSAVENADIVFSMLSTPEVVEQIFFGEEGVLAHMKEGAHWIDCSTVNPSFSLEAAEQSMAHSIQFIDAPVAGTKPHAENAELVFFVGGPDHIISKVEPILLHMGKKVMHIGETGKGASFKMLVNGMLAQSMLVFSETVLLGQKMGLERKFLLDTLPNLVVSAPFTKAKATMIADNNYDVQFPLEWMWKDLHLAALTAYEHQQPLPLLNATKERYAGAVKAGLGRLDFAAIHQYLENN